MLVLVIRLDVASLDCALLPREGIQVEDTPLIGELRACCDTQHNSSSIGDWICDGARAKYLKERLCLVPQVSSKYFDHLIYHLSYHHGLLCFISSS